MDIKNQGVEYLVYLKRLHKSLGTVIKKIENKTELEDGDREIIKATIASFLKMKKNM